MNTVLILYCPPNHSTLSPIWTVLQDNGKVVRYSSDEAIKICTDLRENVNGANTMTVLEFPV